jgi:hypothetical protein
MENWDYNSIIRFLSTISKLIMAENYFRLYHICSKKNDLLLSIADAYKFFFFSRIFELKWITRTWMPFLVNIRNHAVLTKVWCSLHKIDVVVVLIIYELFSIRIMYWTIYILFFTDWHNWWWIHFIFMMIQFTFLYNSFFPNMIYIIQIYQMQYALHHRSGWCKNSKCNECSSLLHTIATTLVLSIHAFAHIIEWCYNS